MGAKQLTPLLALALIIVGCENGPVKVDGTVRLGERAVVARVNDGDTVTVASGAKVRLLQVDAPELYGDCYGASARRTLAEILPPGRPIRLAADPALDRRDRYGRLLRYVFSGGTNVNVELVRRGAASPYFFRTERGRYADALLEAARGARSARRGYWGACPGARLETGLGSITGPAR